MNQQSIYQFLGKWKLATRAAINTINGSIGGALFAILYSCRLNKKYKRKLNVPIFTSGILGGLVGITAICTLCRPWEAFLIGMIGSVLTCTGMFDHVYMRTLCTLCISWAAFMIEMSGNVLTWTGMFDHLYMRTICTLCISWAAFLIGMIGSFLTCTGMFDHVYIKAICTLCRPYGQHF